MYNVVNDFDEGDDLTVLKNQGTGLWIIGSSLCIPDGRVESATFWLKALVFTKTIA